MAKSSFVAEVSFQNAFALSGNHLEQEDTEASVRKFLGNHV